MISLLSFSNVFLIFNLCQAFAVEFTFELEDNAKQCFFEDIQKGTKASLDFQVSCWYALCFVPFINYAF